MVKNESQLKFSLHTNDQCRNYSQLTFDIIVLSCPLGFDFFPEIGKCNCANELQGITIDCNIDKITIGRLSNKFWISYTTDNILLHNGSCPLDYCKDKKVYVPRNNSDIQCSDGRTGKLCGECIHKNYSLVLGTL